MRHSYLPAIRSDNVVAQGDCGMETNAARFAAWWLYRLGDKRDEMVCDSRLVQAAQQQANWLAANDFDEDDPHLGEGGSTPNQRVRATGYKLLDWHKNGNTVESATRSWDEINEVVDDLMAHDTHHDHMWLKGFWRNSTVYGVGNRGQYFVCVTAPPEGDE